MSRAAVRNRQTEAAECGLACLGMAASMAGSEIDLTWLRQRYSVSTRGMTARGLIDIANDIGLSARAIRCELEELSDLKSPSILHWGLNHFVVLERVTRSGVRIFDPARGHRTVSTTEAARAFTGVALELAPAPNFQKRAKRSSLRLFSLMRWTGDIRAGMAQVLILSILLQVYVLASPFYMQIAIDEAAAKGDIELLSGLAIGFAVFAVFNAGAEALRAVALQSVSSLLAWDMSQRLFHHMIRLPLPWFQRRKLADVQSRFQALDPVKALISGGLVGAVIDGGLALTTLVLMTLYAPMLAAVTGGGLLVYVVVRLCGLPLSRRLGAEALLASVAEQGKRLETLRAMQTIKLMGGESKREADWANKLADSVRASQNSALTSSLFATAQRAFEALGGILIIYLGVRAVTAGETTVGTLYAFIAYRSQFMARATSLFDQMINWRLLDVHTERLADIALRAREPGLDRAPDGLPPVRGRLDIDGLMYRYGPRDPWVLKGLNAQIRPGEMVAIVGLSGAGKSTLLKVLCGLYPPTVGDVRLDGLPLSSWGAKAVRQAFGVVMQDDDLLPGSIAENVAFFDEHIDMERVWRCLGLAAIEEEVRAMPMRAETLVGDMGSSLSGGQKQRVLLARALYKEPQVLILDEATSHLDLKRERSINAELKALSMTRIIVAHRPETIAAADRILRLSTDLQEIKRNTQKPQHETA
ncbi:peptidase domain-containing ABC transporter [Caulobacter endophyticus]|uniref:peptidase domain-containing ABC transporter n=1 Tax=Caulobacter endophyticus TaxID=2172652 RepID=UPI0024105FAD|nr:peptidase domain-containing ABC transporter [Caulobacter endophyticus]MDG2528975.1 peptidase domain-containing ABC transporter [Caulobacter endophyticus]